MRAHINPFYDNEIVRLTKKELIECKTIIETIDKIENEMEELLSKLHDIREKARNRSAEEKGGAA